MNRKRFTTALRASMMVGVICLGVVACKKKPDPSASDSAASSELTTTTTTTVPTTTLTEWTGPLTNSQEITWTETQLDQPTTYYVKVSQGEFLNVREGPGTEYKCVAKFTRGQTVVVVARANNWYKTEDGFYVFQDYLTGTMPT